VAQQAYAKGKWALGECARSGRKMLLKHMIADGYYPNLIVDPEWYEPKHPQESLPSLKDPTALYRPSPERDLSGATVRLGTQHAMHTGYELGMPEFSIEIGMEFVESGPVVSVDDPVIIDVDIPGTDTVAGDLAVLFVFSENVAQPIQPKANSSGFIRVLDVQSAARLAMSMGGMIMWKKVTAADLGATKTIRFFSNPAGLTRAWIWTFRNANTDDPVENVFVNFIDNYTAVGVAGSDHSFLMPAPVPTSGIPNGGVIMGWLSDTVVTFVDARQTAQASREILDVGFGTVVVQFQPTGADPVVNNLMSFRTLTETGAGAFFTAVASSFLQHDWNSTGSITDAIRESGIVEEHGFDFSVNLTAGVPYVYALTVKRTSDVTGVNPVSVLVRVDDGTNPAFGEWFTLFANLVAGGPVATVGVGFSDVSYSAILQASVLVCRFTPTVTGSHTFEIRTATSGTTLTHSPIPVVSPDKSLQVINQVLTQDAKLRTLDPSVGSQLTDLENTFSELLSVPAAGRGYFSFALSFKGVSGAVRRQVGVNRFLDRAVDTDRPEFSSGSPANPTMTAPLATPYEAYFPGAYGAQTGTDENFVLLDQPKRLGKHFVEIVIEAGGVAGDPSPAGVTPPLISVGITGVDVRSGGADAGSQIQSWGYRSDGQHTDQTINTTPSDPWFPTSQPVAGTEVVYSMAVDFDNGYCWLYIDGVFAGDLMFGRAGSGGNNVAIGPDLNRYFSPYVKSWDNQTPRPAKITFRVLESQFSAVFARTEIFKGGFLPWDVGPSGFTPGVFDENVNGWNIYYDSNQGDSNFVFTEWPSLVSLSQGPTSVGAWSNALVDGIGRYTGKVFWEVTITTIGVESRIGFTSAFTGQVEVGIGAQGLANQVAFAIQNNGALHGLSGITTTFTTGDVMGMALDIDGQTLEVFKNGVSQGTDVSLTNMYPGMAWIPNVSFETTGTAGAMSINLGETAFAFTIPSGFTSYRDSYALPPATKWLEGTVAGSGFSQRTPTVSGSALNGSALTVDATGLILTDTLLGSGPAPALASGFGRKRGRWYWEITIDAIGTGLLNDVSVGLGLITNIKSVNRVGETSGSASYHADGVTRTAFTINLVSQPAYTTGDVISVMLDMVGMFVTFMKNGVMTDQLGLNGNGNPGQSGTYPSFPYRSVGTDTTRPGVTMGLSGDAVQMTANFGASAFLHADKLPKGYFAYDDMTQVNPL